MHAWTFIFRDQNGLTPVTFLKTENLRTFVHETIRKDAKEHGQVELAEELIADWGDGLTNLVRDWDEQGHEIGFYDNYEKMYLCSAEIRDLDSSQIAPR